jgi:uncharacterized protein
MNFERLIIQQVFARLNSIPVIALLGSRQVGKTTLAKQIQDRIDQECIYLDLESYEDANKLSQPEAYLNERADKLIIIDEVQRMPELFPILRSVIDKNRKNGRFILLGSASPELLAKSSESLAGRISYFELNPFVYSEVSTQISFQKLWLRGGYPEMLLAADDDISYKNRIDFIKTYLERELPLLGLMASPVLLRNLLSMISHIHGNVINYSDISRSLGIDIHTVKRYLDFMEHSYLIRRLQPYYLNISKRLVKSPKIYFRDSGLFHSISGIKNPEDLEGYHLKGNSWEGFVIQQIIAQLKPDVMTYFYKTQDGAELDLVLVKGNMPVLGIEVKYSNSPSSTKGNTISSQDLGNIPVLIITPSVNEDYQIGDAKTVISFANSFVYLKKQDLIY